MHAAGSVVDEPVTWIWKGNGEDTSIDDLIAGFYEAFAGLDGGEFGGRIVKGGAAVGGAEKVGKHFKDKDDVHLELSQQAVAAAVADDSLIVISKLIVQADTCLKTKNFRRESII